VRFFVTHEYNNYTSFGTPCIWHLLFRAKRCRASDVFANIRSSRSWWSCCLRLGSRSFGNWDRGFEPRCTYRRLSSSVYLVLTCVGRGLEQGSPIIAVPTVEKTVPKPVTRGKIRSRITCSVRESLRLNVIIFIQKGSLWKGQQTNRKILQIRNKLLINISQKVLLMKLYTDRKHIYTYTHRLQLNQFEHTG
jgi:hypothetical protein